MAVAPSSVASTLERAPPILPNGVRAAPRITVRGMCRRVPDYVAVPLAVRILTCLLRERLLVAELALFCKHSGTRSRQRRTDHGDLHPGQDFQGHRRCYRAHPRAQRADPRF